MKRFSLVVVALLVAATSLKALDKLKREFEVGSAPELIVDVDAGRISVDKGSSNKIVVYMELENRDRYKLSSEQDGDEVRIDLEHRGVVGWFFFSVDVISGDEPWVRVEVPAHCDLDLATDAGRIEIKGSIEGSINARTGVGSIRIKDVKGDVRARAAGGSINVDETKGSLDAETSTGEVVVRDSDGKFQIETSAGNIEIERASGQFQVSSSVGAIDFDGTVTEGEDNYLKTTVGSIDARLRQAIDIEIDAETDVGNVSISPHVKPVDEGEHHLLVRIGEATKRLRLRSETGSIRIIKGTEDKPAVETEKVETEKEDVKPEETEETDETEAEPLREEIK